MSQIVQEEHPHVVIEQRVEGYLKPFLPDADVEFIQARLANRNSFVATRARGVEK